MNFLLFDFGASRIKSIIYNADSNKFYDLHSTPGASTENIDQVPINFFYESFQNHLSYRESKNKKIHAINICSEMHGFALVKNIENLEKNYYISWRVNNCDNLESELDFYFPGKDFKELTGMKPKKGLPIFNIRNHKNYNEKSFFLTLPDCIMSMFGEWNGTVSKSLAASTGLYNIQKDQWLDSVKYNSNIRFPKVNSKINHTYGHILINKKEIPVYGCIGDLQSCVISLDLKKNDININLGTGSQVSKYFKNYEDNFELRPTFNSNFFSTITHIPCGRVLNTISNLFDKLYENSLKKENTYESVFWNKLFTKSDIKNKNKLLIDLNIFEGSYKYKNGGFIKNINESNLEPQIIIDNIKFSLIKQYSDIINSCKNDPKNKINRVLLTGALSNKIPDFKDILYLDTNINVELIHNEIDSSLIGLSKISRYIFRNKEIMK